MKRIELTRRNERTLPVNINGKDIDLTFDAGSLETKNAVVIMLDDIMQYRERGKKLFDTKDNAFNVKTVSAVRVFTEDGIQLCNDLSRRFGVIFPDWADAVGNNFIDLDIYGELLTAIMDIVTQKETEDKVAEDIGTER